MFPPSSGLLSLMLISSLSLSQAATNNTAPSAVPQCAADCMSIKITEAATWFGQSDVQTYCQHPEFLKAYNQCLGDHCRGKDLTDGKLAGEHTCAGVTPTSVGAPANPNDLKDPTAHPPLAGPAGTPDNSTLTGSKNGTGPNAPNSAPTSANNNPTNLNGALPAATSPNSNSPGSNTTANATRFSGAVGSAAANASSQAGAAIAISSSSAIMFTAFSSCLLSLVI